MPHETVIVDGAFDFSGGVDSQAVTTVRSALVPHGLRRDQLSWLSNGTVRGGAISPRTGYNRLFELLSSGYWQGGIIYDPIDGVSDPYLVCSVAGRIYSAMLNAPYTVVDLSAKYGLVNPWDPATQTPKEAFFVEAQGFLIIQAGDYESAIAAGTTPTLPLFYHSQYTTHTEILRRSRGLNGTYPPGPPTTWQELPAGMAMVYYQNRVWIAQGLVFSAGDIAGSQVSGTAFYSYNDSVLECTECPLVAGTAGGVPADAFRLPTTAGTIRALAYTANLDTNLGQGPLYIFTRKQVYQLIVPITRTDWIATTTDKSPQITVAQINNGAVGERSVLHVNGDLFYQSLAPDIRSLTVATRYYGQWGNVPISDNEARVLLFNDRANMRYLPSLFFDNRMLQGALPIATPNGVAAQALIPLNFDTISRLDEREPPAFEGVNEGLRFLHTFSADFNGLPRAFAIVSTDASTIEVWEFDPGARRDQGDKRISMRAEFPAMTFGQEFELKKLQGGEIWVDQVSGQVDMTVSYRPDADACWHLWTRLSFCSARNCAEDVNNPVCYPVPPYRDSYRFPLTLPKPQPDCKYTPAQRPSDTGYQFQMRVEVVGWCRIRGFVLYAEKRQKALYNGLLCAT